MSYFQFMPDLIIEATRLCDKACQGCYAPNLLKKYNSEEMMQNDFNFLSTERLKKILNENQTLFQNVGQVSIRGGEPSLHPKLNEIINLLRVVNWNIFVETHGRWLLNQVDQKLLTALQLKNIIVKISFDSMHRTSVSDLKAMIRNLTNNNIVWLIAITEPSLIDFLNERERIGWIDDSKIIFQKREIDYEKLIKPRFGVVKVNGDIHHGVTAKQQNIFSVKKDKEAASFA